MEEFDLTKYQTGDYDVVTRDGHPVRILCTDRKINNDYNIIALIPDRFDCEQVFYYSSEGKGFDGNIIKYDDLMLIKKQWRPKKSENYWCLWIHIGEIRVIESIWYDEDVDRLRFKQNNCFRTEEEAQKKVDEILEILKK